MEGLDGLLEQMEADIKQISACPWRTPVLTYLSDTFCAISYSIVVGGGVEAIGGMPLPNIIESRKHMVPANLFLGRAYTWVRDNVFDALTINSTTPRERKAMVEACCNTGFWMPIYMFNLYCTPKMALFQFMKSSVLMAGFALISGPIYGAYVDKMRAACGLPPRHPPSRDQHVAETERPCGLLDEIRTQPVSSQESDQPPCRP